MSKKLTKLFAESCVNCEYCVIHGDNNDLQLLLSKLN